jgi:hypothetical protein
VFKAKIKKFSEEMDNGLILMKQKYIDFIPNVSTRLRYIRSQKPLLFLNNTNPKILDRQIHKIIVGIDYITNLKISIMCGSCRKLKNDCMCEKSFFIIRCFANLIGKSNGVPIKLCVRKLDVLFNLLDVSHAEQLCVLGYLISYDKLSYGFKEFIKFTDIKFSGNFFFNQ